MPSGGIMAVIALAAISYYYVGKPVTKVVKKTGHAIVHVVTLGKY